MPTLPTPLATLLNDPVRHLGGTDLRLTLPLSRALLNEMLDARPDDVPVNELLLEPEAGNRVNLHLGVKVPVLGSVRRKITFVPEEAVTFPDQPWLTLRITDGFKYMDKPILKLMQGQIAERMPRGIELTADHLRLHVPALLTAAGYQKVVPLIASLKLESQANRLVLRLHLRQAD